MKPFGPRVRTRDRSVRGPITSFGTYREIYPWGDVALTQVIPAHEDTASLDYIRTWDSTNPGPPYSSGGAFTSLRVLRPIRDRKGGGTHILLPSAETANMKCVFQSLGFALPDTSHDNMPDISELFQTPGIEPPVSTTLIPTMVPYLAGAYDSIRPKLNKAGLAVFLAEARDIPKMLRTSAEGFHDVWKSIGGKADTPFMQPKKLADHFINHNFGWVPFLNDVKQLADTYDKSNVYIDQITKDNGQWVKRSRKIRHTETRDKIYAGNWIGCQPNDFVLWKFFKNPCFDSNGNPAQNGYFDIYDSVVTDVWAEGSFKYYRPEFDDSLRSHHGAFMAARRLSTLYGLNVNPSVMWKAYPWTWAVDWFANVGSVIDRASSWALDGMVSQYAFAMMHQKHEITSEHLLNWKSGAQVLTWTRVLESKQRQAASPYGFGLVTDDLSPRQLAILAALGISRKWPR
jgi:hypothetical protein